MKIAYIFDAVYPYVKGGVEKRIWEVSRRLAARGHDVHVFGLKYWDGNDTIVQDGVHLHGVGKAMELYTDGRRSIGEAIYFAIKLQIPLLRQKFDVIDCQAAPYFPCFSAKVASVVRGSKLVITWHEVWDNYWKDYLGNWGIIGKAIERVTAHLTSHLVVVSERTEIDLQKLTPGGKIQVVPNGIEIGQFTRVKAADEKSDIIFVGRFIKDKHIDVLINAIGVIRAKMPGVKCVIIGDGPEKDSLKELCDDLQLSGNVRFTGILENHDDVIAQMKSSKVLVLPSTREGFGIVVIEANASGLPVITVKHPKNAASDLINEGNGFICDLSEKDVADKILTAFGRTGDMKTKCIELASRYDWDRITEQYESFYFSL